MNDPIGHIGTNEIEKMGREEIIKLHAACFLWREELRNRNWENDSPDTKAEIDADWSYLHEVVFPLLERLEGNYLGVTEVATLVGMNRRHVNAEIKRGNLVAQKVGKQNMISQKDFEAWRLKPRFGSRKKQD